MASPIRLISGHPRAAAGTSPERAALAAALAVLRQREAEASALRSAVAAATETVWTSDSRRREALAAIETAKQAAADHAVATALGTTTTPPVSIKAARDRLAATDDEAEVAVATRDALKERHAAAESSATFARLTVDRAVSAVIGAAPEVVAAIAAAERAQREYVRTATAVLRLARSDALDLGRWLPDGRSPAQTVLDRISSPLASWSALLNDPALDGAAEWDRALAALLTDADAPLPTVRND